MDQNTQENGTPAGGALAGMPMEQKLALLMEKLADAKPRITDPAKLVVLRDKDGHRIPLTIVTESGIEVVFKPLLVGEARSYDSFIGGKPFAHWTPEEQCRLLNENVISPDLQTQAGGPLTPPWVEKWTSWVTVIQMGAGVLEGSRPDFKVPSITFEDDGEKKSLDPPSDSPSPSSTPSGTTEATTTSETEGSSS